jgi:peptidoglycan biosynthesis protein MviN/MurJ (putative lipid II flippase)
MAALLVLRNVFYWWPLHPIGLAATGVGGAWVCFLVGWLFKRAALNYGGGEFSQRVNPFFYGLILGQFAMAAFWNLVGLCGSGCMDMSGILPGMS